VRSAGWTNGCGSLAFWRSSRASKVSTKDCDGTALRSRSAIDPGTTGADGARHRLAGWRAMIESAAAAALGRKGARCGGSTPRRCRMDRVPQITSASMVGDDWGCAKGVGEPGVVAAPHALGGRGFAGGWIRGGRGALTGFVIATAGRARLARPLSLYDGSAKSRRPPLLVGRWRRRLVPCGASGLGNEAREAVAVRRPLRANRQGRGAVHG